MEVKDFRIGNYVKQQGSVFQEKVTLELLCRSDVILEPIPLIEKILLKYGFEWYNDNLMYINGFFELVWKDNRVYLVVNGQWLSLNIEYLHQLQNLYFALTNKELEINL